MKGGLIGDINWVVKIYICQPNGGEPWTATGFVVNSREVMTAYHVMEAFYNDPEKDWRKVMAIASPGIQLPLFDDLLRGNGDIAILHLSQPHVPTDGFPILNWTSILVPRDRLVCYGFDDNDRQIRVYCRYTGLGSPYLPVHQGYPVYDLEALHGGFEFGDSGAPIMKYNPITGNNEVYGVLIDTDPEDDISGQLGYDAGATPLINQPVLQNFVGWIPLAVRIVGAALEVYRLYVRWQRNQNQGPPASVE
jgi:hypothetical protein